MRVGPARSVVKRQRLHPQQNPRSPTKASTDDLANLPADSDRFLCHFAIRIATGIAILNCKNGKPDQSRSKRFPKRFNLLQVVEQMGQIMCPGKGKFCLLHSRLEVFLNALLCMKAGGGVVRRLSCAKLALRGAEIALGFFDPLPRESLHKAPFPLP